MYAHLHYKFLLQAYIGALVKKLEETRPERVADFKKEAQAGIKNVSFIRHSMLGRLDKTLFYV